MHVLGLDSLYALFQQSKAQSNLEENKIPIIEDLPSACLVSVLHIVPTIASIILLIFNWQGHYIGKELQGPVGYDDLKFLGLQFAAKMLELWALASLSTVMFAIVRAQMISDSLPFGAMTAGFEFTKLSLLWSKEFTATCSTKFSSSANKALLIASIIIFTLLGAAIGPSAAVASQPVLRDWAAGGTSFWINATSQDLWPLVLNNASNSYPICDTTNNGSCSQNANILAKSLLSLWPTYSSPSADHQTLANVIPEKVLLVGQHSTGTMASRFRGPFVYQPDLTATTIPSFAISDAIAQISRYWFMANEQLCGKQLSGYCYYNDIIHTVEAKQPVTYVRCAVSNVNTTIQFARLDQGSGNYPLIDYANATIGSQQWFDLVTNNRTNAAVSWVELPADSFGLSSIAAVVTVPGVNSTAIPDHIYSCTIDSRWANASATISFLGGPVITAGLPYNWFTGGQLQLNSSGFPLWPRIAIAPTWAQAINPFINGSTTSIFSMLCNSVGRLNNVALSTFPLNAIESILSVMITDGLSRIGSSAIIQGGLKGIDDAYPTKTWMKEFLPKAKVFGAGGSAFDYTYREGDQVTMLKATTVVNGYGYGLTAATFLSTFVLLVYSVIAVTYVIYSIFIANTTSSSWESIAELVALAMNSRPSSALQNTGAGIAKLTTYKQQVGIRVSDDRLQIVFEDEKDKERLVTNAPYG
jgi:hypothetical protein